MWRKDKQKQLKEGFLYYDRSSTEMNNTNFKYKTQSNDLYHFFRISSADEAQGGPVSCAVFKVFSLTTNGAEINR